MKRIQSPSSINTYFQCPRKYFFIYNLKMPTSPSIHLVRGTIAHSVLENLFVIEPAILSENFENELKIISLELLKKYWAENKKDLDCLGLLEEELNRYYEETQMMMLNWISHFVKKIKKETSKGLSISEAFVKLKPQTEVLYNSDEFMIRGYIDAIEEIDGEIRLMDYKTSKKSEITKEYRLQLGIYALMYQLKHGIKPHKVGIYFLKDAEKIMEVDEDLIQNAKFMIEQIHMSTDGMDEIHQYPKKESPLCKWSNGSCDFYDYCFGGKKIPEKPLR
jgi:putative RecB family exonuclease